jgi:uncharacterized membrane protein
MTAGGLPPAAFLIQGEGASSHGPRSRVCDHARETFEEGRVDFDHVLDAAVRLFEVVGVGILVIGGLISLIAYARDLSRGHRRTAYVALRHNFGRTILLGLEVLIVADIILTVAIDQSLESAAALGLIVLVRTFLSFSLEIEMDGVLPWRRRATESTLDD